jgi:hypothetical protein
MRSNRTARGSVCTHPIRTPPHINQNLPSKFRRKFVEAVRELAGSEAPRIGVRLPQPEPRDYEPAAGRSQSAYPCGSTTHAGQTPQVVVFELAEPGHDIALKPETAAILYMLPADYSTAQSGAMDDGNRGWHC